jgi:hypothetical protein
MLPLRLVVLALLGVGAAGCPRSKAPLRAPTPEQGLAELARAGGDARLVFDVMDQDSRWSVITAHRDLRAICQLVRAHYPKDRQPRELRRCQTAEAVREPRDFFASQASGWGLLGGLSGLTGKEPLQGQGDRRTVARPGQPALIFCRNGADWSYCGAREELERLKVKTSRDLASVQENTEAYKGGR